uniref:MSV199 domain-containing protein n=1 Tax=viral metagenome TaxID=1070528 RepID=A0A6C0FAT8_9ZZZZ
MQQLDIIELIEKNPISKLSNAYNNKLLTKIQENFTGFEQQLFVSSFYCYLNYDKTLDFVVDLDNVWKWLGFQQKYHAKRMLEKHFNIDIDYKNLASQVGEASSNEEKTAPELAGAVLKDEKINGGQNRQIIMLTIKCFKSLCLKAQTKKAAEIHDYYMKMEEVLHKTIEEETDELRLQLEQKENIILEKENTIIQSKKEKQKAVEQAIVSQFPLNTECIYFGKINNTNEANEKLIKFGHTNDLATRISYHRKQYDNFILVAAFRVQNKVEIENLIKTYPKIKRHIRTIEVNGKKKTEIIAYDSTNFTIEKLSQYIKDVIHSKTYSIDNFNRIMKENEDLQDKMRELNKIVEQNKEIITKQQVEINEMKETIEKQTSLINVTKQETISVYHNAILPEDEFTSKFVEFINTMCIVRPDVEESSTNMEGQFRIWCKTKPKKEVFHALKNYLDTRFKPARISNQNKNQIVHGYIGVKLKSIEYKKKLANSDVETFLFQVCTFSPNGKILNSTLLNEYQRWKKSVNKECNENDMKDLKEYLNSCEYALKAVVWTDYGSNEGYYGLLLKCDEYKHKNMSSNGKKVTKIAVSTGEVIGAWDTIAKAAQAENMSSTKMSIIIKNKKIINNYYYCV